MLERLLISLGRLGAAAGTLRATLPQAPAERPVYRGIDEALAAAGGLDRMLTALVRRAGGQIADANLRIDGRACAP